MDYLDQAIKKAREEGKSSIGKTPYPGKSALGSSRSVSPTGGSMPHEKSGSLIGSKGISPVGAVKYTTTRQVEPEHDVLLHNRVIAGEVDDPRVEAYRQLRSHVLGAMNRHGWKTLAVTSAQEGAGKATTSVNLAISLSLEMNQTVMLVDLDLRKPNVHTTLGIDIDKGIVDHLMHGEPIERVLVNPGYPRLVVLPGLPQGRHVSELLSSPEMKAFMRDIIQRYSDRILIFDLPPLLRNDDAMVFVPNVDACLFVVEEGKNRPDEIERSLDLLKDSELLGTVLNKAR